MATCHKKKVTQRVTSSFLHSQMCQGYFGESLFYKNGI